jgi:hypothetical protein
VSLVATIVCWSLATPPWNSPDEPSQVAHAWALAHGQLLGRTVSSRGLSASLRAFLARHPDLVAVRVPRLYPLLTSKLSCVAFHPLSNAACMAIGKAIAHGTGTWWTYHARYFPFYFAVTGLPSLVSAPGDHQLYLMRLASGLVAAAFLASAITTARQTSQRWLGVGVLIAITPVALFLAACVNASGLEIAAAIALWTSGAVLVRTQSAGDETTDRRLIDRFGLAAIVLVFTRPLAPLWFAAAILVLVVMATPNARQTLIGSRRLRIWGGAIASALAIASAWDLWAGTLDAHHYTGSPVHATVAAMLRHNISHETAYLRQMVGVFGWLDTRSPILVYVLWGALSLAVIVAASRGATRRTMSVLATLIVAAVIAPFLLEDLNVHTIGFQWQGRYTLPLAVAIPILGCSVISAPRWSTHKERIVRIGIGVTVVVAQMLAFVELLRRFSVGTHGPLWFFDRAGWQPPVPALLLVVGELVALSAVVALALTSDRCLEPAAA